MEQKNYLVVLLLVVVFIISVMILLKIKNLNCKGNETYGESYIDTCSPGGTTMSGGKHCCTSDDTSNKNYWGILYNDVHFCLPTGKGNTKDEQYSNCISFCGGPTDSKCLSLCKEGVYG
jgi:hypothetical protein